MDYKKKETQEEFDKRCRQAERERKILSYAPYFWIVVYVLVFIVWPFFSSEVPYDPSTFDD